MNQSLPNVPDEETERRDTRWRWIAAVFLLLTLVAVVVVYLVLESKFPIWRTVEDSG
ncbi:MAG: hypothetical protein ABW073_05600 [Acidimicrobiia bacterium]